MAEILPIAKWVQESYRPGRRIGITWRDGGQRFDAEVIQVGAQIENSTIPERCILEVTQAVHPKDHLVRKHLAIHGHAFSPDGMSRNADGSTDSQAVSYDRLQRSMGDAGLVLDAIRKKTNKRPAYPDGSLLIVVMTPSCLHLTDEWAAMLDAVDDSMEFGPFREVYVYDESTYRGRVFYRPPSAD